MSVHVSLNVFPLKQLDVPIEQIDHKLIPSPLTLKYIKVRENTAAPILTKIFTL